MIHHPERKPGPAYAERLERHVQRRRALAAKAAADPVTADLPLTSTQKTASERRLCRTAVAEKQPFLTFQENNHARLL